MMKNMLKAYVATFAILLIIVILSIDFSSKSLKLKNELIQELNLGWQYTNGDTQEYKIEKLPTNLDMAINEEYTITNTLGEDFQQGNSICIRSSLQNITVKLEEEIVYDKHFQQHGKYTMPMASVWNIIDIPANSQGKIISITLSSPFREMSGKVNKVFYGSKSGLNFLIIKEYGLRFVMALIILFIGIILVVLTLFFNVENNRGFGYLGIFSIFSSLWLIAESRMLQFFTGSQFIIGSLAYIMLSLFPIPILVYLRDYIVKISKKRFTVLIIVFYVNLIKILSLQLLGIADFFTTVKCTHFLMAFSFLVALITMFIEITKYDNNEARKFTKYLMVLTLSGVFELINFMLNNFDNTSIFILMGLLLFIILHLVDYIFTLIQLLKKSYKAEVYQKLALEDRLTGGKNRTAFEIDTEKLFSDKSVTENLRIILCDLNNLKEINDKYGHTFGDIAIQKAYECIKYAFGDCYRIGGDEFASVLLDSSEATYNSKVKIFNDCIFSENKKLPYQFGIAIGSAVYDPSKNLDPMDVINAADHEMYANKLKQKLSIEIKI